MFRVVLFVPLAFAALCYAEFETIPIPNGRIVGGSDASIYEFPQQVSLLYNGRHMCGGSIYSENIVITSAFWVMHVKDIDLTAVVGSTFLSDPKIEILVKKEISHPRFKSWDPDYDVAVLVLSEFLRFGPGAQPIALAKERPPGGTIGTITGWGNIERFGSRSDQLQKIDVNVLSKIECLKVYHIYLTRQNICTYASGKDACDRDHGSPMIVNNQLMGVVSWGRDCAVPGYPRVHASVPDLYNWIIETIEQNTS